MEKKECLYELSGHTDVIYSLLVHFSKSERTDWIFSASSDTKIGLWKKQNSPEWIEGHKAAVLELKKCSELKMASSSLDQYEMNWTFHFFLYLNYFNNPSLKNFFFLF